MIFVEYNSDYQFILFILSNKNQIRHSGGKSKVLKDVLKFDDSCIGLIDEDPESYREPSLDRFDDVTDHGSYKICKNRSSDKLLFELKQDLETWLRVISQNCGLNFNSSWLLDRSRRIRKTLNASQKRKFQQFLDELLDKSSHFQDFVEIFRSANIAGWFFFNLLQVISLPFIWSLRGKPIGGNILLHSKNLAKIINERYLQNWIKHIKERFQS